MAKTTTLSIPARYPATLIISQGDGASLFVNQDTVNSVWLGDTNAIEAGDLLNAVELPPSASTTLTGAQDMFAIASNAPVKLGQMPSGVNFFPGTLAINGNVTATVSGDVNIGNTPDVNATITGTPTVDIASGTVDVTTSAPINVSAGLVQVNQIKPVTLAGLIPAVAAGTTSSVTTVTMPTDAEGYMLITSISSNPITAIFDVVIQHQDGFGSILFTEQITGSIFGADSIIRGKLYGPVLAIKIVNANASFVSTVTAGIFTTANTVTMNIFGLSVYDSGISKRPLVGDGLVVGSFNVTPPGSTTGFPVQNMMDYTGQVNIMSTNTTGGGLVYRFRLLGYQVSTGTSAVMRYVSNTTSGATDSINATIAVPNTFNMLLLDTTAAVSGVVIGQVTAGLAIG